jgi:hypothetical protein
MSVDRRALDAVELMPSYGVTTELPPIESELLCRLSHFGAPPIVRRMTMKRPALVHNRRKQGGRQWRSDRGVP